MAMIDRRVRKYHLSLRIIHWLMAIMIIGLITVGLVMSDLPRNHPDHDLLYSLHKSFGVTALALIVLRVILRLFHGAPPLPASVSRLDNLLAQLGHLTLYALMLAMPISGYIMSNSYGFAVEWFGMKLPRVVHVNKAVSSMAGDIHEIGSKILIAMIIIHVLAVGWHGVRHRINILRRMSF